MAKTAATPWNPSRQLNRGNAAEHILEDLREQVLTGLFPRGTKLPTEKQLAEGYGVSGATVREAIRGLTSVGLVEVRHGSGAYVTGDADKLIGAPLRSMIQMERIGAPELLGVLGALSAYAAELATTQASEEDFASMRAALDAVDTAKDTATITGGLTDFLNAVGSASGNPLLAVLCRFLTRMQVDLAMALCGDSLELWRKTVRRLAKERRALVDAIAARDPAAASAAARNYHERAVKVITALPQHSTGAGLDPLLANMLGMVQGLKPTE